MASDLCKPATTSTTIYLTTHPLYHTFQGRKVGAMAVASRAGGGNHLCVLATFYSGCAHAGL